MMESAFCYQVGGSLAPEAASYVQRQADEALFEALLAGQFSYVLDSRQMGKSSLMVRTIHRLAQAGVRCAAVDITSLGSDQTTPSQWYRGMVADLWRSFKLFGRVNYKTWWHEQDDLSPVQKLHYFLRDVLLEQFPADQLCIFIDETDSVLSLGFSLDDFFALIRFCYNQRSIDSTYERLTFAILGVATPSDLIQDKVRTPFNIGQAIELQGLQLNEAYPLLPGLMPDREQAQRVLREVLIWSGGQPFLTQKLCSIIRQVNHDLANNAAFLPIQAESLWVEALVRDRIIHQWEAQDEPEHLRTIRDRILRPDNRIGRRLGIYQHILQHQSVPLDQSSAQTNLLLSGLVKKQAGHLVIKNPIYQAVFNLDWVDEQLEQLRPYSQTFSAWIAAKRQDQSRLLRGQALQEAQLWARDKVLSDADYQFLAASEACDRKEVQQALEAERSVAIAAQLQQQQRHNRLQKKLLGIIGAACLVSAGLGSIAVSESYRAQANEQRAKESEVDALLASAQGWFDAGRRLDSLIQILHADQQLRQLRQPNPELIDQTDAMLRRIIFGINEVNRFSGHTGEIQQVLYSPDGRLIVSASEDATVKLWRPDGRLLATLATHDQRVSAIQFSPNGQMLAASGGSGTIQLWQTTGELLNTIKAHRTPVISLGFSPDGNTLASGSIGGTIQLWRPDGTLLRTLEGHQAMVRAVVFSPDGQMLASASADTTIKLWQPDTGQLITTLNGHTSTVTNLVFSPDGQRIATSSSDNTVRIWSRSGELLKTLVGHTSAVTSVCFSPDGQMLLSTSEDHEVRFWQQDGTPILAFPGITNVGKSIDFSPDGQYLVSSGRGDEQAVLLWKFDSPLYSVWSGHTAAVLALAMSPDGSILASAGSDQTIKLWQNDGTLLSSVKAHNAPIVKLAFSPGGQTLASTSFDRQLKLWKQDGAPAAMNQLQLTAQSGLVFSPDGRTLAVSDVDQSIKLWHWDSQTVTDIPLDLDTLIYNLAWQPNGNQIATANRDRTVQLWQSDTGKKIATLTGHTEAVRSVAYSPDGALLASASADKTVKLWNPANGSLIRTITGHTDGLWGLEFSPIASDASGLPSILASAGNDKTIKLWNPADGSLLTTLSRHTAIVQSVVFSPDGQTLYSSSGDKTIIQWDLDPILNLDPVDYACSWLADYLANNQNLSNRDRALCTY
ncbi:MAG: AAA-like domain-containing protein [Thainema sp.]